MTLDFSHCPLPPFQHQREDTQAVIDHPYFFIASEMRTGKTKIVIDAAQFLFERSVIDRVIVVAPAPVRDVWYDPKLGEIRKHAWRDLPSLVLQFHKKIRKWGTNPQALDPSAKRLQWLVTNYEFISSTTRLQQVLAWCGPRTLLILDESSYVRTASAKRTKHCLRLRRACGRVVLINGTPIFHSPLDLYSQGNLLHSSILDCPTVTHFKARYEVSQPLYKAGEPVKTATGYQITKNIGWVNLPDLQARFAPYTVRRLQADCLDLPPKLDPVPLTVPLDERTWRIYKQMRDEMVVWLSEDDVAISPTRAVRVMRLSQITNGFLGGIQPLIPDEDSEIKIEEISHEKLDVVLWFVGQQLEADPNTKIVAWGRYRREIERAHDAVKEKYRHLECAIIYGNQKREDRLRALSLLKPETAPQGPVFVAGIEGTGSFGLDFTASHTCLSMSSGYSHGQTAQTLDRVYGPGQTQPVAYFDLIATGPDGQKTIDHIIIEARRAGENIANWTSAAWIKALMEE